MTPEFRLAAACCRWPGDSRRDQAVREAALVGVDWGRFLEEVRRHRIAGLASDALTSASGVPDAVTGQLATEARGMVLANLKLAAESLHIQRLLDEAGVCAVALKGVALAQLAYGSLSFKHARDIDVLVPPEQAEAAWALLEQQGYQLVEPSAPLGADQREALVRFGREIELTSPRHGVAVELKWSPVENPMLLRGLDAHSATQDVTIAGAGAIRTFVDEDLFAYLCVHGASHCWFRLKWLADLNAWLTSKRQEELEALHRFAKAEGVGECAGQALALCRGLLGLRLPASLEPELTRLKVRLLVAGALDAMAGGGAELDLQRRPLGPFRLMPSQFLRGRGLGFFLAQCWLVTQSLDDMLSVPLPRPLHFLYPLLRLPLWLTRIVRRHVGAGRAATPAAPAIGQGQP